jgi:predicted nucleic acid-binding protein
VKVYLDVSCLNRPFDDQGQARIRLEAEAVTIILERCEAGVWQQVSSEIARIEIDANPNAAQRSRVALLLPDEKAILKLAESHFARAGELEVLGFKAADALHVASAEAQGADVLLSCDDRLCRLARRRRRQLQVPVANPVGWLTEIGYAADPGSDPSEGTPGTPP